VTAAELCRAPAGGVVRARGVRRKADGMVNFDPTPEQEALREMAHKFAANEIRPRAGGVGPGRCLFPWNCSGRRSTWV